MVAKIYISAWKQKRQGKPKQNIRNDPPKVKEESTKAHGPLTLEGWKAQQKANYPDLRMASSPSQKKKKVKKRRKKALLEKVIVFSGQQ